MNKRTHACIAFAAIKEVVTLLSGDPALKLLVVGDAQWPSQGGITR